MTPLEAIPQTIVKALSGGDLVYLQNLSGASFAYSTVSSSGDATVQIRFSGRSARISSSNLS